MRIALPSLGVVICTYNSADVILDCLETLLAAADVALDIVVADNASTDGTVSLLHSWAKTRDWHIPDECPFPVSRFKKVRIDLASGAISGSAHQLRLIETGVNGGFAAGVNAGLTVLVKRTCLKRFWILNPDSLVPPGTAAAFATELGSREDFSVMGGRVLYCDATDRIQIDGGTINWFTGVTRNLNQGISHLDAAQPDLAKIDFVTGASMVISRQFYDMVGPMSEDYFLYYEEVDWALRRRTLPLAYCPGGLVYHRAGTAIGSPTPNRPASPFSLYFKHRGRIRFIMRYNPLCLPTALLYSAAKAAQMLLKGCPLESWTIISASLGMPPSRAIRSRLSQEAQRRAFSTY